MLGRDRAVALSPTSVHNGFMHEPPQPGNKEIQDLIWGAYKQVQRLRSQWPPAEPREALPGLPGADQTRAQTNLLEDIQERLGSVQRDLQSLQRELAVQDELRAGEAQGRSGKPHGPHINSAAELFEAVRLGIVEAGEARRLLGLAATENGAGTTDKTGPRPDQPHRAESSGSASG
jgi:hypothetical protein